jgi:predicted ABC-type transport system involved in lysophospholipase L1 biosynthesis ATPase subunit
VAQNVRAGKPLDLLTSGCPSAAGSRRAGDTDAKKHQIGLVPQDLALYDELSARGNLRLFAALYGLSGADKAIASALELLGPADRVNDRVSTYSGAAPAESRGGAAARSGHPAPRRAHGRRRSPER